MNPRKAYWRRWRRKSPAGRKLRQGAEEVQVPGRIARKMLNSQDRRRLGSQRARGWKRAGTQAPKPKIRVRPKSQLADHLLDLAMMMLTKVGRKHA